MNLKRTNQHLIILVALLLVHTTLDAQPSDRSFSGTSRELIGLWSGEGEVIEFRADGKCRYGEDIIPYTLSQGHIILETTGGKVIFGYSLNAGRLILSTDGQQSVYHRLSGIDNVVTPRKEVTNPPDLVGQWCYLTSSTSAHSDRCFTLNADGTYNYTRDRQKSAHAVEESGSPATQESDSGTWFVERDRMYYNSAVKGFGYYRLEKRNHPLNGTDPMIVLDDEPFVSVTPRKPWR